MTHSRLPLKGWMLLSISLGLFNGHAATAQELALAATASLPAASSEPVEGKLGAPFSVALAPGEKQDFNLDLPAGQFLVLCDGQITGDTPRIFGALSLLKRNGANLPGYDGDLAFWNQNERVWRDGAPFKLAKPTGVRFRLKNTGQEPNNYWMHIVKLPADFLPFGFDIPVTPAKIGPNNGAGGTLEAGAVAYQRATIPAGKWDISLSAKAENARAYASLITLDPRGMAVNSELIIAAASETGDQVRKEKTFSFSKPTTLIFRVWNEGAADKTPITYDITIQPSG